MGSFEVPGVYPANALGVLPPEDVIFGRSELMHAVRLKFEKVVAANVPVLICGESGTGKDIVARLLHVRSPWGKGPFVKVHCPAIPGTLLESELFGYERGAFTGANGSKQGRVELAHRGTLFLDEIAELDPAMQAKLLQLLQDGQFCRIGATEDKRVEVRVVCATNRNLEQEMRTGGFRPDLFYRINVVNLQLPPLRSRRGDIPGLIDYFLEFYGDRFGCSVGALSGRVVNEFVNHDWPGNVRELENLVKRYVILGNEDAVLGDLIAERGERYNVEMPNGDGVPLKKQTRRVVLEMERKIILNALQSKNWNRKEAARMLKISYRALLYKIKEAGLPPKRLPMAARPAESGAEQ